MIYFDNNATTALAPEVAALMAETDLQYGNASSVHQSGRAARRLINEAREQVASLLHAPEKCVYFTSGGTESLNLALLGTFFRPSGKRHLIVSSVEHPAVLQAAAFLKKNGIEVSELGVDAAGRIDLAALEAMIRPDTGLIAVMFANNEIGNIYPVKPIADLARARAIPYLCDAVQVCGKLEIRLDHLGLDMMAATAHKFHGPKGAGLLYVREGLELGPLLHGGRQEKGMRPGTENTAAIVGLAAALDLCLKRALQDGMRIRKLRDRLQEGVLQIPGAAIHGDDLHRLDHTINFRIEGVSGEALLINLDMEGVAASVGSACESGSLEPSHVLLAMGLDPSQAFGGLRFSLSRYNTEEEVEAVLRILPKLVDRIRAAA